MKVRNRYRVFRVQLGISIVIHTYTVLCICFFTFTYLMCFFSMWCENVKALQLNQRKKKHPLCFGFPAFWFTALNFLSFITVLYICAKKKEQNPGPLKVDILDGATEKCLRAGISLVHILQLCIWFTEHDMQMRAGVILQLPGTFSLGFCSSHEAAGDKLFCRHFFWVYRGRALDTEAIEFGVTAEVGSTDGT